MSDKREKFVRLAEQRVNRAIRELRLIGNLSNRNAYAFTEEDMRQIFRTLQKELEATKSRFGGAGSGGDNEFRLKSNG